MGRFTLHNDRALFLFVFASQSEPEAHGIEAQKNVLRKAFDDGWWELPQILAALDTCDDLYFDRVSQIRMDAWSHDK